MTINTEFLEKCIATLEKSYQYLLQSSTESIEYEMYRNSLVKSFEITLEQAGKLLKKYMTPYFATKKQADKLMFKDIFRYAHKHGLITEEEANRWLLYRDNRNSTAHDYGQAFAEETVGLAKTLMEDARKIVELINHGA